MTFTTKPPKYVHEGRPTFAVATATGYYCAMRTHREAMTFVRTRPELHNPTIYRVREIWTRARRQWEG